MDLRIIGGDRNDKVRLWRITTTEAPMLQIHVDDVRADEDGSGPRALVFEAADQTERVNVALRAIRRDDYFQNVPAILAVTIAEMGRIEEWSGFDDFVVYPYAREELYGRIRILALRRSELVKVQRYELGDLIIDKGSHEVLVDGRNVLLTAKEFALLVYLSEHRGRVLSREEILVHVWGDDYGVGRRTIDLNVRRLRAKLGASLPLETLRGIGYKLRRELDEAHTTFANGPWTPLLDTARAG